MLSNEPVREKTNNLGFRPGPTQTGLYSHRKRLEASNVRFKKKRDSTIRVAKPKTLISCAVTAQLICVFVFAYADCWFSHAAAQIDTENKHDVLAHLVVPSFHNLLIHLAITP